MAFQVRRVITGHDASGRAVVKIDEVSLHAFVGRPGATGVTCGPRKGSPPTTTPPRTRPAQGRHDRVQRHHLQHPRVRARSGAAQPPHDSIDHIVVLSGEIDMELDDTVVHLKAGDVMVRARHHPQLGQSREPALRAPVILIAAKPVETGGKV